MTDKIIHIIASGHEFIGELAETSEDTIYLRKAIKLMYRNTQQGLMMTMRNLRQNNDYKGNVTINKGPGVIIMELQEFGDLHKGYMQSRTEIVTPNSGIITPQQVKKH